MRRGYRILSVEAADIYKNEQENGAVVGYKLPEKGDARFRLFKILLDDSLDSKELEKAYTRICRRKFSFQDEYTDIEELDAEIVRTFIEKIYVYEAVQDGDRRKQQLQIVYNCVGVIDIPEEKSLAA